jgi:hypothetical protein
MDVPEGYFVNRRRLWARIAELQTLPASPRTPVSTQEVSLTAHLVFNIATSCKTFTARFHKLLHDADVCQHTSAHLMQNLQVLLRAEHVTPVRRLLRLPPRSLITGPQGLTTHSSELLPVKLRGVGLTVQGVVWARELLLRPGAIATVELLYRERGDLQVLHQQSDAATSSSSSAASSGTSNISVGSSTVDAGSNSSGAAVDIESSTLHPGSNRGNIKTADGSSSCSSSGDNGSYSVPELSGDQAAQQLDSGKRPAEHEGMPLSYAAHSVQCIRVTHLRQYGFFVVSVGLYYVHR